MRICTQQYTVCTLSDLFQLLCSNKLISIRSVYYYRNWPIGQVGRVFANGPGDQGSILGQVIPKTQKMVLDTSLPSTQHYVCMKDKVEQ